MMQPDDPDRAPVAPSQAACRGSAATGRSLIRGLLRLQLAPCFAAGAIALGALGCAAVGPAGAQEAYVGRWAVSGDMCSGHGSTAATSALVATDTSLWWFDGYCRIGKMYKARALYVQAHCGGKDVPVTLDAKGDRMTITWDKTVEELMRCK